MTRPTRIDDPRRAAERVARTDGTAPPHDLEAEASLLGAMMLMPAANTP